MRPTLGVLAVAVMVAGGCSNRDNDAASSVSTTTARRTTTSAAAVTTTSSESVPATATANGPCTVPDASPDARASNGAQLLLLDDVATGSAGCAATVTFTFVNPSTDPASAPGFSIGYQDGPLYSEGAGTEVTVAGGDHLVLRLTPVSTANLAVDPIEITYDGPDVLTPTSGPVREVRSLGSFEAQTTWAIGVDGQRPFRAVATANPMRLVITVG